jgi:lycopene beta-cyclase
MPLSKTRIFVEETTLISEPEMSIEELKSRLKDRLRMWGVVPKKRLAVERCRIPMTFPLPDRKQRSLAFGAAASMVHPATGYLLARTIRKAPEVAAAISEEIGKGGPAKDSVSRIWREIWPIDDVRKWELYAFGANFMTKLNGDQLERFFDTFFDLPTEDWHGFMTGEMSAAGVARVMTKVFVTIDSSLRWRLLVESVGVNGGPLLRAAVAH